MALTLARVCLMGEGIKCVLLLISDRKCSHQTKGPQKSVMKYPPKASHDTFVKPTFPFLKCNVILPLCLWLKVEF